MGGERRTRPDTSIPKSRVDAAGNTLIGRTSGALVADRDEALAIIGGWRSAHGWPLNAVNMTLRLRAEKVGGNEAIVAQRLKRLSSIEAKLRREPSMKLSQMHDIGGCRAVLATVEQVEQVVSIAKLGREISQLYKTYDYVGHPKSDGYRGVHLVYRYQSVSESNAVWNGMRIEVQIRSRLQHIWATALETVSTFTGQQLKTGGGEQDWKRFFALMGTAFAMRENRPLVPETPDRMSDLVAELRDLSGFLTVTDLLAGWQAALELLGARKPPRTARFFLLVLDSKAGLVTVTPYTRKEQALAGC